MKPIALIGFMATGKTTVGKKVAAALGREFADLDAMIVETAGKSIADIFVDEGEPGFRKLESACLTRALDIPDRVLATGAGAACQPDNLSILLSKSTVVALSISAEEAVRRAGKASGRPLLDGLGGESDERLGGARALLALREPYYAQAHLRVETVGRGADEVAADVLRWNQQVGEGSGGCWGWELGVKLTCRVIVGVR